MIWVTKPCYSLQPNKFTSTINVHPLHLNRTRSFAWRFPHHHPWPNLLDPNIQQVLEHPTPDNWIWKRHVFTSAAWIFGWFLFLVTPILCMYVCMYKNICIHTVYIYICMVYSIYILWIVYSILYAYKIGGWNMTCMNLLIKHFANLKGSCEDLWVSHVNCTCVLGCQWKNIEHESHKSEVITVCDCTISLNHIKVSTI